MIKNAVIYEDPNMFNINLWVPLCGVPDFFVGHPTSQGHVS